MLSLVVFSSSASVARAFSLPTIPSRISHVPLANPTVCASRPMNALEGDNTKEVSSAQCNWDWKTLAESVFTVDEQRPIVLFDGVCNLCDATINFVMDHDSKAQLRFCSLQSKTAQSLLLQAGQSPTETNKIVLVTPSKTYFAGEAVCRICQKLDPPFLKVLGNLGKSAPRAIREPMYHFVSKRRHIFGENQSCRIDFDGTFTTRFLSDPPDTTDV